MENPELHTANNKLQHAIQILNQAVSKTTI